MDFFDEEDDAPEQPRRRASSPPPEPSGSVASSGGGGGGPSRQQIRARQAILAVGAILMLILIVIAFRGCLNARTDRSYENYVSDLSSITAETEQLSTTLFETLSGGSESDIGLSGEVNGDVSTMQGLLDRAQGLDAPDDIDAAQQQIELSYELRHDALEGIAAQVDKLGGEQEEEAVDAIYTQIKVLSASDILFARARDQIEAALTEEEVVVSDGVPESQFLPTPGEGDNPDYLDPEAVQSAFTGAAGDGGGSPTSDAECQGDGETHGLGLVDGGTTLQPSGTVLTAGGGVSAPQGDDSIEVSVQNQGTADESGVDVTVSSEDGSIDSTETISTIAAGATETVTVPLGTTPKAGDSLTLNVVATPVGCEEIEDNNEASYPVTF